MVGVEIQPSPRVARDRSTAAAAVSRSRRRGLRLLWVAAALAAGGCVETHAVQFRLVADSSCTTTSASATARGLGPAAIALARSLRVRLLGTEEHTTRCAPISAQRDIPGIAGQLRSVASADQKLNALSEGAYEIVITASSNGSCTRDGAVICGASKFSLPPVGEPVSVHLGCYSAAGDQPTSGSRAGPPAGFLGCTRGAWAAGNTTDGRVAGGDGGAAGDLTSSCSKDDWCRNSVPKTGTFESVWASGGGEIFVVGRSGVIVHFDGSHWSAMKSGTTHNLNGVWGSSSSRVYAGGDGGTLLRYDGKAWSSMDAETGDDIQAIWGASSSDVFFATNDGRIGKLSSGSWTVTRTSSGGNLRALGGTSGSRAYAAGDNGTILRLDDGRWSAMSSHTQEDLRGIYAVSSKEVYAAGMNATVVRFDGSEWHAVQTPARGGTHLLGAAGHGSTVYIVGRSGTILRGSGGSWRAESSGVTTQLESVWVTEHLAVAVGDSGVVLVKKR